MPCTLGVFGERVGHLQVSGLDLRPDGGRVEPGPIGEPVHARDEVLECVGDDEVGTVTLERLDGAWGTSAEKPLTRERGPVLAGDVGVLLETYTLCNAARGLCCAYEETRTLSVSPDPATKSPVNHRRCSWVGSDPLMVAYHDTEWGVPLHDDQKLFEFMVLDAMQAGLSWRIVLQKRQNFAHALDGFDPARVARYSERYLDRLVTTEGIIRNRQKLAATITNAQAVLTIQEELGSLDSYLWKFVDGRPTVHAWTTGGQIPAKNAEAEAMSRDLKKRGFKFVGATICYAFMQAAGLVNDHLTSCFRYEEVARV